jgi:hypothetical protein
VIKDSRESPALLDSLDPVAQLEQRVRLEQQGQQVKMVKLVSKDLRVTLDRWANKVSKVRQVLRVSLEQRVRSEHREQLEYQAELDRWVHRVRLVSKVHRVTLEMPECRVSEERVDPVDPRASKDHRATPARLDNLEPRALLETQDRLASKVLVDTLGRLATRVTPAPLDPRDLLDHVARLEQLEYLVTRAQLVPPDNRVHREQLDQ